jgi:hypothetical protein
VLKSGRITSGNRLADAGRTTRTKCKSGGNGAIKVHVGFGSVAEKEVRGKERGVEEGVVRAVL